MNVAYESSQLLAEYLLFHYGQADEVLPTDRVWPDGMREALGFPLRTVGHFKSGDVATGLDLGCAVGRSTFEMARDCRRVVGVDYSHNFIAAAQRLAAGQEVSYERLDEAHLSTPLVASRPPEVDASRVEFLQADAMDLPADIGAFDRVHAANLLCRLAEPQRLLDRLPSLVVPRGELVLATPCTWLEAFTPSENWPQGPTIDWLTEHLSAAFTLVSQADEPFLIRETARKFQWSASMVTVWKRR